VSYNEICKTDPKINRFSRATIRSAPQFAKSYAPRVGFCKLWRGPNAELWLYEFNLHFWWFVLSFNKLVVFIYHPDQNLKLSKIMMPMEHQEMSCNDKFQLAGSTANVWLCYTCLFWPKLTQLLYLGCFYSYLNCFMDTLRPNGEQNAMVPYF